MQPPTDRMVILTPQVPMLNFSRRLAATFAMLAALTVLGCEAPAGPTGPEGPAGPQGTAGPE